jgi:hypothetical protein
MEPENSLSGLQGPANCFVWAKLIQSTSLRLILILSPIYAYVFEMVSFHYLSPPYLSKVFSSSLHVPRGLIILLSSILSPEY